MIFLVLGVIRLNTRRISEVLVGAGNPDLLLRTPNDRYNDTKMSFVTRHATFDLTSTTLAIHFTRKPVNNSLIRSTPTSRRSTYNNMGQDVRTYVRPQKVFSDSDEIWYAGRGR